MPNEINDLAIAWLARLDRTEDDPTVQAELVEWLAKDSRHRGAFLRAEAAWHTLDRAAALASNDTPRPAMDMANVFDRRGFMIGGSVAAAVAASAASIFWWQRDPVDVVETSIGEVRAVPLRDRSRATLNGGSRLRVTMSDKLRTASLERGEAWFEVVKDQTRPFVVEAADARVRAVGTAFAVRRSADGASVEVTEGVVDIWNAARPNDRLRVSQGAQVTLEGPDGPKLITTSLEAVERSLAWRQGQLAFAGDTLESAADQFNRYNSVRIVIADRQLRSRRMIGRFRMNEPVAFAEAAGSMFGANVDVTADRIVIGGDPR
jgi:transmembrane sensor